MRIPAQGSTEVFAYVVIPPGLLLLDVAGPVEALRKANLLQDRVQFRVGYIGPKPQVLSSIGLAVTGIAPLPGTLPDGCIVIVAGNTGEPLGLPAASGEDDAADEKRIIDWLSQAIRPGIRLVTICSGALLAAQAGLLDDHDCTTHHECIDDLAVLAPAARVRENRLFVEDRERMSSAGITAGIDLMLHLIATTIDHACALAVARYLVVYMRRSGGDPQLSPWLEGRNHMHPAIHRAQDAIAADPGRNWSVTTVAQAAGTSPRNLSRHFNEQAGMSVTDYVNRMRLSLARELLTGSRLDIESVAERSGFSSPRQLRRAWGRLHELPPSRMRAQV